jgi:D-glycero-D-manno-heptose 1,7-bisphosphate phosphatase
MTQPARPLRQAVFFDRDGVLIEALPVDGKPGAISDVDELRYTPDARRVCRELTALGIPLFIFTNQPDVGRGLVPQAAVEAINDAVQAELGITAVAVSWSGDNTDPLRKPNPGMLLALAAEHGIDLTRSVAVGDRWRDIEAGRRAGARTLLIDRGWPEQQADRPDATVQELGDGLDWILEQLGAASG